jgi:osmotically-inducible protein OsmY
VLQYVQGASSGEPKSDQEIVGAVKDMNENLLVQLSNGSVFLTGTVNDRDTARSLVDQTKEIPGVIQVSFELGLQQD